MKTLLIFISIFFFYVTANAQSFTLSEMIKLLDYNEDDFDTYVTKKGYVYYEIQENSTLVQTSYVYKEDGARKYYITKSHYKGSDIQGVAFQTGNNKTYLKIKEELKDLGFEYLNKEIRDGMTYFYYSKDKMQLSLCSWVQTNDYGYKNTLYEILVTK